MGGLGDSTKGRARRNDRARGINAFVRVRGSVLVPEEACKRGTSAGAVEGGSLYSRFDNPPNPLSEVSMGGNSGDR